MYVINPYHLASVCVHIADQLQTVLYQEYPTNWPEFTPRDKIADWLENYATVQDLVVWMDTELRERPVYDAVAHEWSITLSRKGSPVHLRPAHIVLATGSFGAPRTPAVPGVERFRGRVFHSSAYCGGAAFAGQRVAVIGAGPSGLQYAATLREHGFTVRLFDRSPGPGGNWLSTDVRPVKAAIPYALSAILGS